MSGRTRNSSSGCSRLQGDSRRVTPNPQHIPYPDSPCPSLHWENSGAIRALQGGARVTEECSDAPHQCHPMLGDTAACPHMKQGNKIPLVPIPPLPTSGGCTLHLEGLSALWVPLRQLRAGQEVGAHLWGTGSHSFLPVQKGPSEQQVLPAKRGIVEQTRAPCYLGSQGQVEQVGSVALPPPVQQALGFLHCSPLQGRDTSSPSAPSLELMLTPHLLYCSHLPHGASCLWQGCCPAPPGMQCPHAQQCLAAPEDDNGALGGVRCWAP